MDKMMRSIVWDDVARRATRRNPQSLQNNHTLYYRLVSLQQELSAYLNTRNKLSRNARFMASESGRSLGVNRVKTLTPEESAHVESMAARYGFARSMHKLFDDMIVFMTKQMSVIERAGEMREWMDFYGA